MRCASGAPTSCPTSSLSPTADGGAPVTLPRPDRCCPRKYREATCSVRTEIGVGAPVLYGRHPGCARPASSGPDDPVEAAVAALQAGGRIALPKRQLRALALLACQRLGTDPVRRPDRGQHGVRWYARITGWTASRVESGLSAPEIAGLFLDALDVGRTPPISHPHLRALITAAREETESLLPSGRTDHGPA